MYLPDMRTGPMELAMHSALDLKGPAYKYCLPHGASNKNEGWCSLEEGACCCTFSRVLINFFIPSGNDRLAERRPSAFRNQHRGHVRRTSS